MSRKLRGLLNFCAVLFLPLALLPLLVIYHAATTGLTFGAVAPMPAATLFLQLLVCEVCGFAGRYGGLAMDKWGFSSVLRRILAVPAGVVLAAGIYALFAWKNSLAAPGIAVLGARWSAVFQLWGDPFAPRVCWLPDGICDRSDRNGIVSGESRGGDTVCRGVISGPAAGAVRLQSGRDRFYDGAPPPSV